jgi:hypothetical protein
MFRFEMGEMFRVSRLGFRVVERETPNPKPETFQRFQVEHIFPSPLVDPVCEVAEERHV